MTAYLTLADAKALLDTACGTKVYATQVHGELWALFNVPTVPSDDPRDYLTIGIERIDEPSEFGIDAPGFESDDDALDHVRKRAEEGSRLHRRALELHHAADSMRNHLWGPDMVESRCGPEMAE